MKIQVIVSEIETAEELYDVAESLGTCTVENGHRFTVRSAPNEQVGFVATMLQHLSDLKEA